MILVLIGVIVRITFALISATSALIRTALTTGLEVVVVLPVLTITKVTIVILVIFVKNNHIPPYLIYLKGHGPEFDNRYLARVERNEDKLLR